MYLTPKCINLAIYTSVYIRISFLQEMYDKILGKSNKIRSQFTYFSKNSYLLLLNITVPTFLLGPGWKLEFKYITATGLLVKVTHTYMFFKSIINIQSRLVYGSYKIIYNLGPPGKIKNFILNGLLALITTKLTDSVCDYCKYPYGKDAIQKKQFYEAMKSPDKMTIIMLKYLKCYLVTRTNKNTFWDLDKQKNCRHLTRLVVTILTDRNQPCIDRGAIEGKTTKLAVSPGFCIIVSSGGCRGAQPGLRAPFWQGLLRCTSDRKYIPKSADRILVKSWTACYKGKSCREIPLRKWFFRKVGTNSYQNGHGKLVASKTCTSRPSSNQNRFQVLDINHKSEESNSVTHVIKTDKFININVINCIVQFRKSKVGYLSFVFNVACKNLCGTIRQYCMLQNIAKVNVIYYVLINSGKNKLKHALKYMLHVFMIIKGNSYTLVFECKSKKCFLLTLWQCLKFSYCQNKIAKKYGIIKFECKLMKFVLLTLRLCLEPIYCQNKIVKNYGIIKLECELMKFALTLGQCLKLLYCQNKIAKNYDIVKSECNSKKLVPTLWQCLKLTYCQNKIAKNYDIIKSECKSMNFVLLTLWLCLEPIYCQNKIVKNYGIIKSECNLKKLALTLWQCLKLTYCQNKTAKKCDIIKSGKYSNNKSLVLSNENWNTLTIKYELVFADSNNLYFMTRFHKCKKNIDVAIGNAPVYYYIYKRMNTMQLWASEPEWKAGNGYCTHDTITAIRAMLFIYLFTWIYFYNGYENSILMQGLYSKVACKQVRTAIWSMLFIYLFTWIYFYNGYENSILMQGLYSRVACKQERPMMARIRYLSKNIRKVSSTYISRNFITYKQGRRVIWAHQNKHGSVLSIYLFTWTYFYNGNEKQTSRTIKYELVFADSNTLYLMVGFHKCKKNIDVAIGNAPVYYIYKRMNTMPLWKSGNGYRTHAIISRCLKIFYPIIYQNKIAKNCDIIKSGKYFNNKSYVLYKQVRTVIWSILFIYLFTWIYFYNGYENSILMQGLYSRVACKQERPMMARIRYLSKTDRKVTSTYVSRNFIKYKHVRTIILPHQIKHEAVLFIYLCTWIYFQNGYENQKSSICAAFIMPDMTQKFLTTRTKMTDITVLWPCEQKQNVCLFVTEVVLWPSDQKQNVCLLVTEVRQIENVCLFVNDSIGTTFCTPCHKILKVNKETNSGLSNSGIVSWLVPPVVRRFNCSQHKKLKRDING